MSQAQAQVQQPKAFNLITEGCGYLNRVREVPIKKGQPYLACTINALEGVEGSVEYVSFDLKIVGRQAKEAINLLRQAVDDKQKVFVGFRAGSPRPDFYEYTKDGETRQVEGFKARLLQLTFALVNGEKFEIPLVERSASESESPSGDDDAQSLASSGPVEPEAQQPSAPPVRDRTAVRGFQPSARH